MRSSCCSTWRMLLRYSSRIARSGAPSVPRSFAVSCHHRVEQALLLLEARGALLGRAGLAEHPLEGHARVDADRQRAGVVAPGEALKKVHGKPSQAPTAVPMSSVPTSIDRSGVSPATMSAMY